MPDIAFVILMISLFVIGLCFVFFITMASHPYATVFKPFMWFARTLYKEKDFCITLSIKNERLYSYQKGWLFWDERNYSEINFSLSFDEINDQIYRNTEALKQAHQKRQAEADKIKRLKKQGKRYLFANQISKL